MPKKPIKKEETPPDEMNPEDGQKVGLKDQKPASDEAGQMDARWKKVESIVNAAKDAYTSGKSSFSDVIGSMLSTLQDLLASETGGGEMGGLTGGPQMDLPPEPAPEEQQQ